jgi:VanZ family protein
MRLPWLSSHRLWYAGFLAWAVALYVLSSMPKVLPEGGPEIPNLDKIVHFGYFMGGAFILATGILLRKGVGTHPLLRIFLPALLFAAIGMLDEFHQTFTPGRSGNDAFDWLADILGSFTGILIANRFHPLVLKFSQPVPEKSKI